MQAPISKLGLLPSAPELHRPHQDTGGDEEHREGVELAQPLERAQALPLRFHLVLDLRAEALLLALRGAECAHQAHVAHDVGEIAAHVRGLACEVSMQLAPARSPPRDERSENAHHGEQHRRQMPVDRAEHQDAGDHRDARRNCVPGERALDEPGRVGCGRDAARERPGELFHEVACALSRQMIEQVHADVPADGDESVSGRPAGDSPQDVVAGDQPQQNADGAP